MFSSFVIPAMCILAEQDGGVAAPMPPAHSGSAATILLMVDWVLAGLGAVVAIFFLYRMKRGGWRDPLAFAPARESDLREDAIALTILAYLIAIAVLSLGAQWLPGGRETALANTLVGVGAQAVGVVACLVVVAKRVPGGVARFVFGSPQEFAGGTVGLAGGGLLVVSAVCPLLLLGSMTLVRWLVPDLEFPDHPTISALHDSESPLGFRILLWSGAVIVAPVAEEVFFRGLLQSVMLNVWRRRWLAIAVSAGAFAIIHQSQPHAIPALFALAVILGYTYERSGSLVPPIAIHALFNLKTLVWDALTPPM